MAAFIQKFFKGRKTSEKPVQAESTPEAPSQDLLVEQQQVLANNPSDEILEQLALEGKTAELRLQAAIRLTDPETLQRLQKSARGRDKGVYQVVRQKLQELRDAEAGRQRLADAILTVIKQAEDHAKTDNTQLYEARFENLLKQWETLEPTASNEQKTRFLSAAHRCRERIQQSRQAEEAAETQADKARERAQTLNVLKSTLEELKAQPEDRTASLSSLDAMQTTQENRWLEATRDADVSKAEQKSYEILMHDLRGYISAVQRLQQRSEQISALLDTGVGDSSPQQHDHELLTTLVREIDWPTGYDQPSELNKIQAMAGDSRPKPKPRPQADPQTPEKEELTNTLEALEQALEARQLKESRHHFKRAQQQMSALQDRNGKSFQARFQLLHGQLRELQDWQGFATQPKQISLCERMEHLADQHMEPEIKAEKIKELQNEWRELGGSSDRDLWQRFKQASDLAYEPCRDYFSAKSGLKKVNLEKRREICHQLALFVEQIDWASVDWKAVERIDRVAKEEWKAAWPVEFRDNRAIQKQFDALLAKLEEPLNTERDKNEAMKRAIVERAEALMSHEPLAEAMELAKALQGEWKAIGITRHRQDRKLWQAFRAACDSVFGRRDAQKQEQAAQNREAEARMEGLLQRSAELTAAADQPTLLAMAEELQNAGTEPASPGMTGRLRLELQRLKTLQRDIQRAEQLAGWHQRIQARVDSTLHPDTCPKGWAQRAEALAGMTAAELVIRAEILTEQPSPTEDQALRMEIQVKRLADGMSGSRHSGDLQDQLESLVAAWCLGDASTVRPKNLADRLAAALNASS
ncbi:DUF349 domain-containing protein [Marinobacter changyiensis]|uniref:DUF349 domain-containing protein n=1 Tax=Marinobacter changyiensis TaxID=2604091 RepID=UPI0015D4691E|nr:DUF349 domain-containing protein [Marinobacter changyiensis]